MPLVELLHALRLLQSLRQLRSSHLRSLMIHHDEQENVIEEILPGV